jgi:hypothetical protein
MHKSRAVLPLMFLTLLSARKPPPEPVCIQGMCFSGIHWSNDGTIEGILENYFGGSVGRVAMEWTAYSGNSMAGDMHAEIQSLPQGSRWAFRLYLPSIASDRVLTSVQGVSLQFLDRTVDLRTLPKVCYANRKTC